MRARNGQVAVCLALTLVALCVLAVMNVGVFVSVRMKNRLMNAGDAAALAVARHQGVLLNRIGQRNIDHLMLLIRCTGRPGALSPEECREKCLELEREQARDCFLGPLEGIAEGNLIAQRNDVSPNEAMCDILKRHVIDIRTGYAENPELYPPPWENAWEEYAQRLEMEIGAGLCVGPDNVDFVDDLAGHLLLTKQFYNAVAGRNWCWFHFNAPGVLSSYSGFGDWGPLPRPDDPTRFRRCANSEVYSLHLQPRTGSALVLFGKDLIRYLTGATDAEIADSIMIRDPLQTWYLYGERWDAWSTYPGIRFEPSSFPITGSVKSEYDVLGCAAICRVIGTMPDVVAERGERTISWFAAAKPFGSVLDESGERAPVTALGRLVTPAFSDVRLVPVDSVGGRDLSTADPLWMNHVHDHLAGYLAGGPASLGGCWYCAQLRAWEDDHLRETAREWLRSNSSSCIRSSGPGHERGGTPHGH